MSDILNEYEKQQEQRVRTGLKKFMTKAILMLTCSHLVHINFGYLNNKNSTYPERFQELDTKYDGSIDKMIEGKANEYIEWLNTIRDTDRGEDDDNDELEIKHMIECWNQFIIISGLTEINSLHSTSQHKLFTDFHNTLNAA